SHERRRSPGRQRSPAPGKTPRRAAARARPAEQRAAGLGPDRAEAAAPSSGPDPARKRNRGGEGAGLRPEPALPRSAGGLRPRPDLKGRAGPDPRGLRPAAPDPPPPDRR